MSVYYLLGAGITKMSKAQPLPLKNLYFSEDTYYILLFIENQQLQPDTCYNGVYKKEHPKLLGGFRKVIIKEGRDVENEEQLAGFELENGED